MNWIVLTLPIAGIAMLVIGLWISHRLMPLKYVDDDTEFDVTTGVAAVLADKVAKAIRSERSSVVRGSAIREMLIRGGIARDPTPADVLEFDIKAVQRELAHK